MNKINFKPNIDFLKITAIITMVIDHFNFIIFDRRYEFLTCVGRLAFPLFAFILVYNFYYHTHNQVNYLKRLLIFALISQPVFAFAISPYRFNIFFTLFLGATALLVFNKERLRLYPYLILPVLWGLFSFYLPGFDVDYGLAGVLFVYTLGIFVEYFNIVWGIGALLFMAFINFKGVDLNSWLKVISGLSSVVIIYFSQFFHSKKSIFIKYKYWFYIFYPAHLLVLFIIRLLRF